MKEARAHAKKVIHKARREGSLDILEGKAEKMVKKGAFVQLSGEEIMEMTETTPLIYPI